MSPEHYLQGGGLTAKTVHAIISRLLAWLFVHK